MLGRSLRLELAPHGASAGVLYPGWVATPIANAARGHNPTATALTQYTFRGPLGRFIEPEEIATAVADGIQTRAPRVIHPRVWRPISALRDVVAAATDPVMRHDSHDPPPHKPARTRSHHAPTPLETACAHGRATLPRSGQSRSTSSTHPTSLFAMSTTLAAGGGSVRGSV
jgi:hypothetical protein